MHHQLEQPGHRGATSADTRRAFGYQVNDNSQQQTPVAGADAYAVIRGDVSALLEGSYGTCVIEEQTVTTFEDPDLPAPGGVFVYMVHGRSTRCGLGTLGFASNEEERINLNPNSC